MVLGHNGGWGEWSPWSKWSTCTRTCGGGISRQQRRCRRNRPCKGKIWTTRYKICNPEQAEFLDNVNNNTRPQKKAFCSGTKTNCFLHTYSDVLKQNLFPENSYLVTFMRYTYAISDVSGDLSSIDGKVELLNRSFAGHYCDPLDDWRKLIGFVTEQVPSEGSLQSNRRLPRPNINCSTQRLLLNGWSSEKDWGQ
ncbi:A disintegrin and metalloproteinase with thrombospondin motifs 18 [Acromyrmex echinatior]|uniref:A disintegrin and metalloproteinase with thrombospondin motifs 18 n=1 Tax=Acromyrmex echinatior TaxID=103372 RepID=F4X7M1_ACREC|nr:A disintegrin and metalloproteinase with thrombospondin motifs 18 [Acromyrmex echinatior]